MIAAAITLGALVHLAVGALLARWAYGIHRAHALDMYAEKGWRDPLAHWRDGDGRFGAFWSAFLAFIASPVWILTVGVVLFVGSTTRKSNWEKEQELKESKARTAALEAENETLARKLRQPR